VVFIGREKYRDIDRETESYRIERRSLGLGQGVCAVPTIGDVAMVGALSAFSSRYGGHVALPMRHRNCGKLTRRAKFRLTRRANQSYRFARLTRQEGRIAIVTNARWDAVDAAAAGTQVVAGRDQLRERSYGAPTNDAEAYGEIVWF
jgi:hypothetical protein